MSLWIIDKCHYLMMKKRNSFLKYFYFMYENAHISSPEILQHQSERHLKVNELILNF